MKLDRNFLRQHYSSLSDEALLELDRSELVAEAQQIFEEELTQRGLDGSPDSSTFPATEFVSENGDRMEFVDSPAREDGSPGWMDEAAEVYAESAHQGRPPAEHATQGREALEAAGIPCHLELHEIPREEQALPDPTHRWRLIVPGEFSQKATNILDRDVFNPEFEEDWKTHLHSMSDKELRAINPQSEFLGLFDRIARITRAYNDELKRRKLV